MEHHNRPLIPEKTKRKITHMVKNEPFCPFCDLKKYKLKYEFINAIPKTLLPYSRKILYSNEYFFVIPDISPITEYHLLIISKQHYMSIKMIPQRMLPSLYQAKEFIEQKLKLVTKKSVIYFEHGTCTQVEAACIAHAHLHCLPLSEVDIKDLLQSILSVDEDSDIEDDGGNYMYMEVKKGLSFTWADTFKMKQFLRRLLAEVLKMPNRKSWQQSLSLDKERSISEVWLAKTVKLFQG